MMSNLVMIGGVENCDFVVQVKLFDTIQETIYNSVVNEEWLFRGTVSWNEWYCLLLKLLPALTKE